MVLSIWFCPKKEVRHFVKTTETICYLLKTLHTPPPIITDIRKYWLMNCTNIFCIVPFVGILAVLTISWDNSNFRTGMYEKGDTEPGWRIITGCVIQL